MNIWPLYTVLYLALTVSITSCGGGSDSNSLNTTSYSIGGTVNGLSSQLILSINNTPYSINTNGVFTFPFSFNNSSRYTVIVDQHPTGQSCNIDNESGTVAGANINNIVVNCGDNHSIAGTIYSTVLTVVDSDVNDSYATANISNNLTSSAQQIQNLSTIHGFSSKSPTGRQGDRFEFSADEVDIFQVDLQKDQNIHMQVVDFSGVDVFQGDLDLILLDSGENIVASSLNTTEFEQLTVPSDGNFYIVVSAYDGTSKYTLRIDSLSSSEQPAKQTMNFIANEAIIKFKPASQSAFTTKNSRLTFTHRDKSRATLAHISHEKPVQSLLSTKKNDFISQLKNKNKNSYEKLMTLLEIKHLKQQPDIEYAEPNYIYQAQLVPNDALYNLQWHYPNINLPQAWDITTGTPASGNVIVAVIDTGIFLAHSDLSGQLISGYDFISSTSNSNDGDGIDSNPDDPGDDTQVGNSSWHGTHVAGTIAARTNNNTGLAGVSWGARIMPLRVLGTQGGTSFDITQAIRFAAGLSNNSNTVPPQVADIINLSLGGPGFSQATQDTIDQARAAGVIIIAAAGNDNSSELFYPASYNGVVSVSAIDFQNNRAPYSNYGNFIDASAPGGNLNSDANNDGYGDGVLSTLLMIQVAHENLHLFITREHQWLHPI